MVTSCFRIYSISYRAGAVDWCVRFPRPMGRSESISAPLNLLAVGIRLVDVDRFYRRLSQLANHREFNGTLSLGLFVLAIRRALATRRRFPDDCLALEYLCVAETLDYLWRNYRYPFDPLSMGRATIVDRNISQWPPPQSQTDTTGSSRNVNERLIEFLSGDHEYREGTISLRDVVDTQRIARRD